MEERNSCCHDQWLLTKLHDFKELECFDCNDDDLNGFFRKDALAHKDELLAEIYSLTYQKATDKGVSPPVAFVSFHNDAVHLSNRVKKEILPSSKWYPVYPAVKIGRLGVVKELQGSNIGTTLLNIAKKFFVQDNRTGCRFLTVDAYNKPKTIHFYEKNGFQILSVPTRSQNGGMKEEETKTMYFDLKRFLLP